MNRHRIAFSDFWDAGSGKRIFFPLLERVLGPSRAIEVAPHDRPDVIIFSVFGRKHLRYLEQPIRRVFFTGEDFSRNLFPSDFAMSFDLDAESDAHMRFPLWHAYEKEVERALALDHVRRWKIGSTASECTERDNLCTWVSSTPSDNRSDLVRGFIEHVGPVSCGGKIMNNIGGPVENKLSFLQTGCFSFALENTCRPGYCTEKLLEAFIAGAIPIYRGDTEASRDFNPKAFINVHEYEDDAALWRYLRELIRQPERIRAMAQEPIFTDSTRIRLTRGRRAWEQKLVCGILGERALRKSA